MSKLVRFSHNRILALRFFHAQDDFPDFVESEPSDPRRYAQELLIAIEDEASVDYLEALISECKKSINRHAKWCMENTFYDTPKEEHPEWWTKYAEEGYS